MTWTRSSARTGIRSGPGLWRRVACTFIISTKMMKVHHRVHRPARGLRHREYLLAKVVWLAAVAISLQVSGQVRTPESDRERPPFHGPSGTAHSLPGQPGRQ
jgi:hypothetical protein